MRFSKWQALGNTYLLVERGDLVAPLGADDVRRLCDPHCRVGADGVLEIGEVRGAEAEVVVWNPDGSSAELSGNGARIAAVWLARRSGVAFHGCTSENAPFPRASRARMSRSTSAKPTWGSPKRSR